MFCNKCGQQNADNANFCSNCGAQMNTQPPSFQQPQYQQPVNPYLSQGYQQPNISPNDELSKTQKSIFIIGLVAFVMHIFWTGFNFFGMRILDFSFYSRSRFFITPLSIISSLVIPFLCFLFVKNETYRRLLLIFFIILAVIEIGDQMAGVFFRKFF